jgi:hypothetical protein
MSSAAKSIYSVMQFYSERLAANMLIRLAANMLIRLAASTMRTLSDAE